jgi:hypothetical protein
VDDPVERALEKANLRLTEAADGRSSPADVDAALERARAAIESLALASAQMQAGLPDAIQDGLKEHFRPSARHIAEMRGLMNQVVRRLERLEGDLLAERHARVDDLALLVDLVASGWQSVNDRLARIEEKLDQPRLRSVS